MDFKRYNVKEKQKEKGRKKKKTRIIKKQTNKTTTTTTKKQKTTNNHPKTIYGVCLKKNFFFKIVIVGYRNKN